MNIKNLTISQKVLGLLSFIAVLTFVINAFSIFQFYSGENEANTIINEVINEVENDKSINNVDQSSESNDKIKATADHLKRSMQSDLRISIGFLVFTLLSIIFAMTIMIKQVVSPLRATRKYIAEIEKGNFDAKIDVNSTNPEDEIGAIIGAISSMKETAYKSDRILSAVNATTTAIMICDSSGSIVYVNPSLNALFEKYKETLCKMLKNFDINNIEGLHPTEWDAQFNVKEGKAKVICFGGVIFDVTMQKSFNKKGEHLGFVWQWNDLTDQVLVQAEIEAIIGSAVEGDLSFRLDLDGKTGFFKDFSSGVNGLLNIQSEVLNNVSGVLQKISDGDLTVRMEGDYQNLFADIQGNTNKTIENLHSTVSKIQSMSHSIDRAITEMAAGSDDLSNRTENQASSIEETAASMEELTSTVKQNSDHSAQASNLSSENREVANEGGRTMREAVDALQRISTASDKIAEIISVIDEIAFQTNLLALNASVESARAGDAGRGFAVVADEVRNLAQRSAESSSQIKALITDSVKEVKSGVDLVNRTNETLGKITESASTVASIISEISDASAEQANGLEQVNTTISHMDEITQKNASLVQQNTSIIHDLKNQSNSLSDVVSSFKLGSENLSSNNQIVDDISDSVISDAGSFDASKNIEKPIIQDPEKSFEQSHDESHDHGLKIETANFEVENDQVKESDSEWAEF